MLARNRNKSYALIPFFLSFLLSMCSPLPYGLNCGLGNGSLHLHACQLVENCFGLVSFCDKSRSCTFNWGSPRICLQKLSSVIGASDVMSIMWMTLDARKTNTTFEGKFGTLNSKDECLSANQKKCSGRPAVSGRHFLKTRPEIVIGIESILAMAAVCLPHKTRGPCPGSTPASC